jgi:hypothetical protein
MTAAWTDLGQVGSTSDVMALAVLGGVVYAGVDDQVYRYDGASWVDTTPGGGFGCSYICTLAAWNGKLYMTDSDLASVWEYDGANWAKVRDSTSGWGLATWNGLLVLGCMGGNVWSYNGATWTDLGKPGGNVCCLVDNGGTLYAGIGYGNVCRYDGGTTWSSCGILGSSGTVGGLSVIGSTLYGTNNDHVYRYDGGTIWTDLGEHSGADGAPTMVSHLGKLYAGTSPGGSVHRYDGSWTDLGQLDANTYVDSVASDGTAYLYAGTYDSGHVYRLSSDPPDVQVGHAPARADGGGIVSDDSRFTTCVTDALDFELDASGNLKRDYTPSSQCRVRLCARRGKWPYDAEVGSRFYGATMREAQRKALQWAKEALSPLVEDGSITTVEVPEVAVSDQAGEFDARVQIGLPTENPVTVVGSFRLVN